MEKKTGKDNIVFCLVGKDALQPEVRSSSSRTKMWDKVMTGPSSTASGAKPSSKVTKAATAVGEQASVAAKASVVANASVAAKASVVADAPVVTKASSSYTKSQTAKAGQTGITIIKEGGIAPTTSGGDSQAPAVSMVKSSKPRVPASVVSVAGVPASVAAASSTPEAGGNTSTTSKTNRPSKTDRTRASTDSTLKTDRASTDSTLKTDGTRQSAPVSTTNKSKSGGGSPLSGGEHIPAIIKPKPTMTEKLIKTKEHAQKVCKTVIESKILVSIMVFLCTMLLLICLNPPMAQEQDSTTKQRSWKKIMVWSSLAMFLALLLPYTCKPAATN